MKKIAMLAFKLLLFVIILFFISLIVDIVHYPGEDAYYRVQFEKIKDEPSFVRCVFNGIRSLPDWARDFDANLSLFKTLKLYFLSFFEGGVRQYLPQVRNNLRRYHFPVSGDEETALYIEDRFIARGIMKGTVL